MFNNIETIVFQVTTKCPFHCPQCYMSRGSEDIPLEDVVSILDSSFAKQLRAVQITGGEPLVYPHLVDVLRAAKNRKLYSFLATSGYGLSESKLKELMNCGLTALCVSLNSPIGQDNLLTRDMFDTSISAIKYAHMRGLTCFCNTVVTDSNVDILPLLADCVLKHGVSGINLLRPVASYCGSYIPQLSADTIDKLYSIVQEYRGLFFVENCFKEYWERAKCQKFSCGDIGKTMFFVNADTTFSPCSKQLCKRYKTIEDMINARDAWLGGCD